jgi:hypothetical protein
MQKVFHLVLSNANCFGFDRLGQIFCISPLEIQPCRQRHRCNPTGRAEYPLKDRRIPI